MNSLIHKAFDPEEFRREGHKLVDQLSTYLEDCLSGKPMPVLPPSDPDALAEFWKKDLETPGFKLHDFYSTLIRQSNHLHHPRYMGHQVVPPAPLSALTELLEAFLNNGMAIYEMGPASTAIERTVIQWLAGKMGFSDKADGVLTSGGSAGNLTALLAARQAMCGFNVWDEGNTASEPLALMVSEEAHYSVSRAARIMGWGEKGVVKVLVNKRMQLDASKLEETHQAAIAKGLKVIAIVGNACTTSTGTYDPLNNMADFAAKHGLWFHVDGAHGGAAALAGKYKHLTHGIERADSLVIDFHKMMLAPALTTAVLFKNGQHAGETFAQKAEYLLGDGQQKPWYDSAGRTLECTKKMMGVKVYVMLKLYGEELFRDYITGTYDLGKELAGLIGLYNDVELAVEPDGNIVCFRCCPEGFNGDLNTLNAMVRQEIVKKAEFYIVQTSIKGRIFLRVTLMNPFTGNHDLRLLLNEIRDTAGNIATALMQKVH